MATYHISEAEAARDFAGLLARVEAGDEVVIERDERAIATVSPARRPGVLLSVALARARARSSTVTLDPDFRRDLEEVISSHREPLDPPEWD